MSIPLFRVEPYLKQNFANLAGFHGAIALSGARFVGGAWRILSPVYGLSVRFLTLEFTKESENSAFWKNAP
jgi:hypothetical protein